MRRACQITLNDANRLILERWSRGRSTQARLVPRGRVVLSAAESKENKAIAVELHISRGAVAVGVTASQRWALPASKRMRHAVDDR